MRKYSFLLIVGLLVFVTPFLGIPESWKSILLFALGTAIVLSALAYRFTARKENRSDKEEFYEERRPSPSTHPIHEV